MIHLVSVIYTGERAGAHVSGVYVLSNEFYFNRANRKKINFIGKNINLKKKKTKHKTNVSLPINVLSEKGKQKQNTYAYKLTI